MTDGQHQADVPEEKPNEPPIAMTDAEREIHKELIQENVIAEQELRNVVRRLAAARRRYEARLGRR